MRSTHPIAVNISPLFIRLAIAVTMIWAGLGKVLGEMPVSGQAAADLANMGVDIPAPDAAPRATPDAATDAATDGPADTPSGDDAVPLPRGSAMAGSPAIMLASFQPESDPDAQPAPGAQPEASPEAAPRTEPGSVTDPAASSPAFTAADFPSERSVRRVYGIALLTNKAGQEIQRADGTTAPPIWPAWAVDGNMPVIIAWSAAITELVAGVFILVGFLTRLSGLAVAGVMLSAVWLTEIGPAIQSGDVLLGFLPAGRVWYDPGAWSTLLWQFTLMMAALTLTFLGSGSLALDRALFGVRNDIEDDADDDEDV